MNLGALTSFVGIALAALVGWWLWDSERKKRLRSFARSRERIPLAIQASQWYRDFNADDVVGLLRELGDIYQLDPELLRPDDSFESSLRDLNVSFADIKYEIVCSRFKQKVSKATSEELQLPKTVRDYIEQLRFSPQGPP